MTGRDIGSLTGGKRPKNYVYGLLFLTKNIYFSGLVLAHWKRA
jgi:hypothetical protein